MSPKARSETYWCVSALIKVMFEAIIGEFLSLGESKHALSNIDVDRPIDNKGKKTILDKYFLRNDVDWQAHVFKGRERSI